MRLAYIVLAYKLPSQAVRLVRKLSDDGVTFFVHVDRKTPDDVYEAIVAGLRDVPRVEWLSRRRCYWSGFGIVAAMLEAIERIAGDPDGFEYTTSLAADTYPLRSNREIRAYLRSLEGRSVLEHEPFPARGLTGGGLERIERWHSPNVFGRHASFPNRYGNILLKRRFPAGLQPYSGSGGWCLSSDCVRYVAGFVVANPRFVRFFKRVFAPDESLFQTIVLNSRFADSLVNDDLRYIDWSGPHPLPKILTSADFDALMGSGDLFARKFDIRRDAEILDLIDQAIARRDPSADPLQVSLGVRRDAVQLEVPPDDEL